MSTQGNYAEPVCIPATAAGQDFFRSNAGADLPDGVNDTTEDISRPGRIGLGNVAAPLASIDMATGARSGTATQSTVASLYSTSALPSIIPTVLPATDVVAFKHSNQTAGIGIAYDGFYSAGTAATQHMGWMLKGAGVFRHIWEAASTANYDLWSNISAAVGRIVVTRTFIGGVNQGNFYSAVIQAVGQVRMQWDIRTNNAMTAAMRLEPDLAELGNTTLKIGEQRANNRKVVLFEGGATSSTSFYGFGINNGTLRYQIAATNTNRHAFFGGSSLIMEMLGNGTVRMHGLPVFANDAAAASLATNTLYRSPAGVLHIKN